MGNFELSGQDISIHYTAHNKTLVVRAKDLVGHEEQKFSDVKLSESDIGATITVVLLSSSRNGTRFLLHLIVPGTAPPVHHQYATKSLTGTMHA